MDSNTAMQWGLLAFLILFLFGVVFKTGKTRKMRITTSEPDANGQLKVIEVTRKWNGGWDDAKGMACYVLNGKKIWLSTHWIIRIEEM
jgi:hypothetical protein